MVGIRLAVFLLISILIIVTIFSTLQIRKVDFFVWNNEKEVLEFVDKKIILFKNKEEKIKIEKKDLDKDGYLETYILENSILKILEKKDLIWQSDKDWIVDDFALGDVDGDEIEEISLSVWKPGNFGEMMPFWVEENDMSIKNHFFVYRFVGDKIESVWQSSNLLKPNCKITLEDMDKDGIVELVVIEGNYNDKNCEKGNLAVWEWDGWGFKNLWRSDVFYFGFKISGSDLLVY